MSVKLTTFLAGSANFLHEMDISAKLELLQVKFGMKQNQKRDIIIKLKLKEQHN